MYRSSFEGFIASFANFLLQIKYNGDASGSTVAINLYFKYDSMYWLLEKAFFCGCRLLFSWHCPICKEAQHRCLLCTHFNKVKNVKAFLVTSKPLRFYNLFVKFQFPCSFV